MPEEMKYLQNVIINYNYNTLKIYIPKSSSLKIFLSIQQRGKPWKKQKGNISDPIKSTNL